MLRETAKIAFLANLRCNIAPILYKWSTVIWCFYTQFFFTQYIIEVILSLFFLFFWPKKSNIQKYSCTWTNTKYDFFSVNASQYFIFCIFAIQKFSWKCDLKCHMKLMDTILEQKIHSFCTIKIFQTFVYMYHYTTACTCSW